MLVIVDHIDINRNQPSYEKDCYHTLVQMIIEFKHFLCSMLDKEFVIYLWENGVLAFLSLIVAWFDFFATFDTLTECVNWFLIELLQFSPNWTNTVIVSQGLSPFALNLMAFISKATSNCHVQQWFPDCRCNIVSFKCQNNCLTMGYNRSSKKYLILGQH